MEIASTAALPMMESQPHPAKGGSAATDDGFGFDDLLDIVNPLQHIPIVGTIYRELTGDEIGPTARLAGGTLYGGLMGFLGTLGAIAFEGITGDTIDHTIVSLFEGNDPANAQKAYAAAQSLTPQTAE